MKKLFLPLSLLFVFSAEVVASEPFSVRLGTRDNKNALASNRVISYVEIQSKEDNLRIDNVVINRGRCEVAPFTRNLTPSLPQQISFGETARVETNPNFACSIIEVQIDTNHGSFTFSK